MYELSSPPGMLARGQARQARKTRRWRLVLILATSSFIVPPFRHRHPLGYGLHACGRLTSCPVGGEKMLTACEPPGPIRDDCQDPASRSPSPTRPPATHGRTRTSAAAQMASLIRSSCARCRPGRPGRRPPRTVAGRIAHQLGIGSAAISTRPAPHGRRPGSPPNARRRVPCAHTALTPPRRDTATAHLAWKPMFLLSPSTAAALGTRAI